MSKCNQEEIEVLREKIERKRLQLKKKLENEPRKNLDQAAIRLSQSLDKLLNEYTNCF
ncbi:Spo0E family sporulation regulatory protein-aspartic acid phosphatase [Sporohalobacter salinus]|uniref:Spo0E family sporulation regulatory protein-aspartic acid phosphatase n=1 Tax=Sporohalobacter salinus TaxID=1494606 RepID=UPI00195F3D8E|nr:Spo0E family sporulation regulatory protein-aspartic acid phosphatase [Sporohalobacter salinus]MBM7622998.1 ABC-type phosphate transport system auxiliary subunit [Sporohalobacter salinus]